MNGKHAASEGFQAPGNDATAEGTKNDEELKDDNNKSQSGIGEDRKLPAKHIYPQVCAEYHYAWVERRFGDIGKHRAERMSESKGEDCLL